MGSVTRIGCPGYHLKKRRQEKGCGERKGTGKNGDFGFD